MGFRLVGSYGAVKDAAFVNMPASGVVHPGEVVDFLRTSGQGVSPAGMASTVTTIFGVCLDYAQGASDTYVRVIPFAPGQIWEADCATSAATAHIGIRMGLSRERAQLVLNNDATDSLLSTAVFHCIGMTGLTTGSGKLLGFFRAGIPVGVPNTGLLGANGAY